MAASAVSPIWPRRCSRSSEAGSAWEPPQAFPTLVSCRPRGNARAGRALTRVRSANSTWAQTFVVEAALRATKTIPIVFRRTTIPRNRPFGSPLASAAVAASPAHETATLERLAVAEADLRRARANGRPLAKDVLEDLMLMFKGTAEHHVPSGPARGAEPDVVRFEKYARLTIHCAQSLAPFQSPTFKAIGGTDAGARPKGNSPVHHSQHFLLSRSLSSPFVSRFGGVSECRARSGVTSHRRFQCNREGRRFRAACSDLCC